MKISVIIPAFNAAAYIQRALESVLRQTRPADEIIVVDDGSTDGTAQAVRSLDKGILLISQKNAGTGAARNTGIKAASGDWIAFLDADDLWLPEKLQLQQQHLLRNPDLKWTTGNYIHRIETENRQAEASDRNTLERILGSKEFFDSYFTACLHNAWGNTDTLMVEKKVLHEMHLFDVSLPRDEDIDLWFRIAYRYPTIGFLAQPLAVYTLDIAGSRIRANRDSRTFVDFVKKHLCLAEQNHCVEFEKVATFMINNWLRGGLFDDRIYTLREVLEAFPNYGSTEIKQRVRWLTVCPGFSGFVLRGLSRVSRGLKLRKHVSRPHLRDA
jgi:glycosyltransferase involved in cell wall biosynthesis